ncbi:MAG TPA: alpha/beta hydrolase [Gemmatimonadaceae bacterium]|nr:alpha/beta hydrolase [Gemmatimonadaceae bacterium]
MLPLLLAGYSRFVILPSPSHQWADRAPHTAHFVRVAPDVRLHYLDFGGNGPALVFLAGLGNTAHAFDDFAPAFRDRFHVYAITRRGFGESDHPPDGYDTTRLVDDIRAVLDSLHIAHATFAGHSIAGEELTRLAATYPSRVDKLVYLDAAYDRVRAQEEFDRLYPVPPDIAPPPEPSAADTATAAAYVAFVHRTRGVNIPEADIRTRFRYDGWNEQRTVAFRSMTSERPDYRSIRVPALAIYAVTDSVSQLEPWERNDALHRLAYKELVHDIEAVYAPMRAQFRSAVARGQVVELHGAHHWIFVSNREAVTSAMRRFLLSTSR